MTISEKVLLLLKNNKFTKMEMSARLDISRPTLDSRIEEGNWKRLERFWVNTSYGYHSKRF